MKIAPYWKAVVAVASAVLVALNAFASDMVITGDERWNIYLAALTAYGVWRVKNKDAKASDKKE